MKLPDHFNITNTPTPIARLERYSSAPKGYSIWIKRDDFTGLELSGNKVRKLDFLMKEAQISGAERVITCGGLQSNHCRAVAAYAARLGMVSSLILRGEKPEILAGNFFLDKLLGADIHFVSGEEYKKADVIMKDIAGGYKESSYIIPEGGSNELGAWGYIKCFLEIQKQSREMKCDFNAIVVASGSGGTHAGLLLGKLITNSQAEIISVNVCEDAAYFRDKIHDIMLRFTARYNYNLNWNKEAIRVIDGFVGAGYAKAGRREIDLIKQLAREEGLFIDPVYGAKAFLGMMHSIHSSDIPGPEVLYIHTGGIFSLFAYAGELMSS